MVVRIEVNDQLAPYVLIDPDGPSVYPLFLRSVGVNYLESKQ